MDQRPSAPSRTDAAYLSIGEVADATGLSLRSIRYYQEVGLVIPSAHTRGGHRLYTDVDIDRLRLIMKMKPLEFSLQEMGSLLRARDAMQDPSVTGPEYDQAVDRLRMYAALVEQRWQTLKDQLAISEDFRGQLADELTRHETESAS